MEVIWRPGDEERERTNAMRLAGRLGFDDYWELVRFSAEEPERFWPAAIEDMGLEFSRPWDTVVDLSRGPEWATWFVGGKLNLAWNCVHRWARGARARRRGADAAGARRVLGRGGGVVAGGARAAGGRLGASVPLDVHLGDDGPAEGRAARPGRVPRIDHAGGLLPGGRAAGGRDPFRHRHGLDHGPVGSGRRDGLGLHRGVRRGRA